jgi:hypothetical protein
VDDEHATNTMSNPLFTERFGSGARHSTQHRTGNTKGKHGARDIPGTSEALT